MLRATAVAAVVFPPLPDRLREYGQNVLYQQPVTTFSTYSRGG